MARLHRLESKSGEIHDFHRMLRETAGKLNDRLKKASSDRRWKEAAVADSEPPVKSLVKVLRVLDCEGFGPYAASAVTRYHYRKARPGEKKQLDRIERDFKKFMIGKTPQERKAAGEFIGKKMGAALDAGIKLGLAAGLHGPQIEVATWTPMGSSSEATKTEGKCKQQQ